MIERIAEASPRFKARIAGSFFAQLTDGSIHRALRSRSFNIAGGLIASPAWSRDASVVQKAHREKVRDL